MQDAGTNNRVTFSQRKQPIFRDGTGGFYTKWRLRNERRNSILMTCHNPDLATASDWMKQIFNQSEAVHRKGYCASSVWNFCARFSGVISRGNHRWRSEMWVFSQAAIRHLHISHNASHLPPKIFHNLCFSFLLSITAVPREMENNMLNAKLWGTNKVHYERCASGQYLSRMHWSELTTDLA